MKAFVTVVLLGVCAGAMFSGAARADEVKVAVAANFKGTMERIGKEFTAKTGHSVVISSAATGVLYTQITHGAPFDLFLSADMEYPRRLVEAGLAMPESLFEYGRGRLVVWMRNDSPVDPTTLGIEALAQPSVRTVAIANPAFPRMQDYGIIAMSMWRRTRDAEI